MRNNFLNTLLAFLMLSAPAAVFAGGWTGASKVTMVYPYGSMVEGSDQQVLVRLETSPANATEVGFNPDSCSGTFYYLLSSKNTSFDVMYALILSVQASQAPVNLFLNGCSGGGTNGWPLVLHVQLNQP